MFVRCARIDIDIGEIAATTARDANFLCHVFVMVDHQHLQALLRRHTRTKQAGCAGTDYGDVKGLQRLVYLAGGVSKPPI